MRAISRRVSDHPSWASRGLVSGVAVRFWGVRGSIACPDRCVARYGGNTSCVEVRCGDNLLILDGGSGIRQLGKALLGCRNGATVTLTLPVGRRRVKVMQVLTVHDLAAGSH